MAEDNPAIDDLESSLDFDSDRSNKVSPMQDIANAIEALLSEEHCDQKTIINTENEIGLIQIDVIQAHMLKCFGTDFPSLTALKISKQEHAVSVGGKRSEQIVDIFKSMQTNIVTGEPSLTNKLMGRRF